MRAERSSAVLLHDHLVASAAAAPERVAITAGALRLTYAELLARATGLANALAKRGVERGDRVLVLGDNTVDTVVGFWATLVASAVAVIVSPQTRAERLSYLLEDTRATALLTSATHASALLEAAPRSPHLRAVVVEGALAEDQLARLPGGVAWAAAEASAGPTEPPPRLAIEVDLAVIIYTSGTTGHPKGVMHTHASLRAAARSIVTYLGLVQEDVLLGALPLAFGYGLLQLIASTVVGARLVLERGLTFPAHVLARIAAERVTCLAGVPSVFVLLGGLESAAKADVGAVRIVTSAAAALSERHIAIVRRLFPSARLFSMYGQTECLRATYVPPDALDRKPTSIGVPIPSTEAWIVDDQDRRLPSGEAGQLVVRGPNLMLGYWERPTETAARLRPGPLPGEYVLYTGDLARIDEEGFFHFVARMDDIIKSRGEKVAPHEVEAAIARAPGVREVAVIGVPDELLGEAIKAFVVLEPGAELSTKELQRHCQAHLESYMVPKHVAFVTDLPRTTTGKITKLGLS